MPHSVTPESTPAEDSSRTISQVDTVKSEPESQDVEMDDNRSELSSTNGGPKPNAEEDEAMDADGGLFGDDEEVEYVKHDQYAFP